MKKSETMLVHFSLCIFHNYNYTNGGACGGLLVYAAKEVRCPDPLANLIGLASAGNMGDAVVRCGTFAN